MVDSAFGVMGELFRNNSKNIAAAVFDLAVQLDRQLYQRLYAIAPVSFAARRRLFIFSFSTAWAACTPQLARTPQLEGAAMQSRPKAVSLAHEHLKLNRSLFFSTSDPEISEAEFSAQVEQFDLAWKMISGRLDGSQKAQSLAGLKRCIEEVLGDDDIEPHKVSALVAELSEVLPKMSAAF